MDYKKTQDILNKYAKYVVQQSRSNLTKDKKGSGALYSSINYELDYENNIFLLEFLMEDYGEYVDRGVKGKSPNSLPKGSKWYGIQKAPTSPFKFGAMKSRGLRAAINKWTVQKGINGIRDKKGRFIKRKSLQYLITRSIYLSGIKANFFLQNHLKKD